MTLPQPTAFSALVTERLRVALFSAAIRRGVQGTVNVTDASAQRQA
jgi:hypothetical protein